MLCVIDLPCDFSNSDWNMRLSTILNLSERAALSSLGGLLAYLLQHRIVIQGNSPPTVKGIKTIPKSPQPLQFQANKDICR